MIKELDIVTLTHDVKAYGLTKGSRGAVVHCYQDGQGFEVEFTDAARQSSHVVTLERADITLERDAIQARMIELLNSLPEDSLTEVRDFLEFLNQKQQHQVDKSGLFIHFS
ncbi:MAG: DUF4926 domain-containing protein [Leptolyngbyaceae cyanobacterium MAG.088]|nr:DUF4926 domain-containing protein [Leptolyngbyaceae cyanobacterium MAG.088]